MICVKRYEINLFFGLRLLLLNFKKNFALCCEEKCFFRNLVANLARNESFFLGFGLNCAVRTVFWKGIGYFLKGFSYVVFVGVFELLAGLGRRWSFFWRIWGTFRRGRIGRLFDRYVAVWCCRIWWGLFLGLDVRVEGYRICRLCIFLKRRDFIVFFELFLWICSYFFSSNSFQLPKINKKNKKNKYNYNKILKGGVTFSSVDECWFLSLLLICILFCSSCLMSLFLFHCFIVSFMGIEEVNTYNFV